MNRSDKISGLDASLSRRHLLAGALATVAGLFWSNAAGAFQGVSRPTKARPRRTGRALRLKGLQTLVQESLYSRRPLDRAASLMFGLTAVKAFIVDHQNHDCILVGEVDARFPVLYLDDFVTALRNVWLSPEDPACSIDPRQEDLSAFMQIVASSRQAKAPKQMQEVLSRMSELGKRPHRVSVFGIPFKSRFAKGLVDADYHMKKVAGGTVPHPAGQRSFQDLVFDWMIAEAKQRCAAAGDETPLMSRFWFHPATPAYEEAEDIFSLKRVAAKLLTEEEHLTASGQRSQTHKSHPAAAQFAAEFTEHYAEAAEQEAKYARLQNLYRLVALAIFLQRRQAFERTDLDLDLWLTAYSQADAGVSETVDGIATVKHDEITCSGPIGIMRGPVWMPMCGGAVVARHELADQATVANTPKSLDPVRRAVVEAEPAPGKILVWDFPLPTGDLT